MSAGTASLRTPAPASSSLVPRGRVEPGRRYIGCVASRTCHLAGVRLCRLWPIGPSRRRDGQFWRAFSIASARLSDPCPAHKALDHPCRGRTRRAVRTIDRLELVDPAAHLGKIEPHQAPGCEIVADDRFGHQAPSTAGKQQRVFGAEIGQSPRLIAEHPDVMVFGEGRPHREDQLPVAARFPRQSRLAACQADAETTPPGSFRPRRHEYARDPASSCAAPRPHRCRRCLPARAARRRRGPRRTRAT